MRLIGYVKTRLIEQLGELDLDEQGRSIAEFCSIHHHELTKMVADDLDTEDALNEALEADADGIVVIDPLVIADTVRAAHEIAVELIKRKKHLFIVCSQKHIDPQSTESEQELVDSCVYLLLRKVG